MLENEVADTAVVLTRVANGWLALSGRGSELSDKTGHEVNRNNRRFEAFA
jgi:hypothetical protein